MASYGGATVQGDLLRGTVAEAKTLTVDRLKRVLRGESLPQGGLKNELQMRLIAHIENVARRNDHDRLRRIRDAIRNQNPQTYYTASSLAGPYGAYPSPYSNHTPASSASPQFHHSPTPRLGPPVSLAMPPNPGYSANRITFKESPFYTIQKQLTNVLELKAREQTRDTVRLTINLDETLAARFQTDPTCRALVFCAAESFESAYKPVDIAFPHHAELKCNQEDLKVNLKGLKNKPGSTRPVDITHLLRKKAGFPNTVELVYALTNKKYFLLVQFVQKRPVESLVDDLKRGKYLSRDRVISEMRARLDDDEIVAVSTNMSLKDPVQMTRIDTPCRAMSCKHNQCFDAAVYLALQEQAPTWTCPICNKPAPYESLVFDQYVQHILQSTSDDTEQVTIEPDGRWHLIKSEEDDRKQSNNSFSNRNDSDDDDDDDLVEIVDPDVPRTTVTTIRTKDPTPDIRTPPIGGRDGSFPPPRPPSTSFMNSTSQPQSQSKKRSREEVIDLTLSDDDDGNQPPVSRMKRPPLPSQVSDSNRLGGAGPVRFHLPPPVTYPADMAGSGSGWGDYDFNDFNSTRF